MTLLLSIPFEWKSNHSIQSEVSKFYAALKMERLLRTSIRIWITAKFIANI
jgi:hypothetical protein